MRKCAVILPAIALAAGIAGLFLRHKELEIVFDSTTGLMEPGAPVTMALLGLSAVIILMSIIFAAIVTRGYDAKMEYVRAFSQSSLIYLAVTFLLALVMLFADAMCFTALMKRGSPQAVEVVFIIFAALTAISFVVMARGAYKGRSGPEMMLFGVIPSVFLCLWMVIMYMEKASDPVVLGYGYQCIAIAAAALSFYYGAGFVFKKTNPGKTVFTYLLTIYFCTVILLDNISIWPRLFFAVILVVQFLNAVLFIGNLIKKTEDDYTPQIESSQKDM